MRKALLVLAAASMLQGCIVYQYGGPFVTKVEADPAGLKVERCKIKFNVWTGHFENDACAAETVKTAK